VRIDQPRQPVLANIDPISGTPRVFNIDLATAFAAHLGVPLELKVFDTAASSMPSRTSAPTLASLR
jgi:hypothetical protein